MALPRQRCDHAGDISFSTIASILAVGNHTPFEDAGGPSTTAELKRGDVASRGYLVRHHGMCVPMGCAGSPN